MLVLVINLLEDQFLFTLATSLNFPLSLQPIGQVAAILVRGLSIVFHVGGEVDRTDGAAGAVARVGVGPVDGQAVVDQYVARLGADRDLLGFVVGAEVHYPLRETQRFCAGVRA